MVRRILAMMIAGLILAAPLSCATPEARKRSHAEAIIVPTDQPQLRFIVVSGDWGEAAKAPEMSWFQWLVYGPDRPQRRMGLRNPQGLALRIRTETESSGPPHAELLIADQGYPDVAALNLETGKLRRWLRAGEKPYCPVAVAARSDGCVFVADTTRGAVLQFSPDGRLERLLSPKENRDRSEPRTLVRADSRIQNPDRKGAKPLPGRGEESTTPAGIAGSSRAAPAGGAGLSQAMPGSPHLFRPTSLLIVDDLMYIADSGSGRIQRFDLLQAAWLDPIGASAANPPLVAPVGLAMLPDGTLLVADAVTAAVHRIGSEGQRLGTIGSRGRGPCQFVRPMQIVTTIGGLIFVADAAKQVIAVLNESGECLGEIGGGDSMGELPLTLPTGLAVINDDYVPLLSEIALNRIGCRPSEWVVVSDPLGTTAMRWLGILQDCDGP